MREAAKIARGNSHPERGRSLIERKQRVPSRDEREKFECAGAEHPARGGGTDCVVKLAPLIEKNNPHWIGRSILRRMRERLDQSIPAVEQDFQQLVAKLLVTDRVA